MKNTITLALILFCSNIQAQLTENWEYSNFATQNVWNGNIEHFQTQGNMLVLNGDADNGGDDIIFREVDYGLSFDIEFSVNMDFNASGSNYAELYFLANNDKLTSAFEAYKILIGGTNDNISLIKTTHNSAKVIIEGTHNLIDENSVNVEIKLSYDGQGNFTLSSTTNNGTPLETLRGSDTSPLTGNYLALHCKYTKTRADLFSFGSINIDIVPDLEAPQINSYSTQSNKSINIYFNEEIDQSRLDEMELVFSPDNNVSTYSYTDKLLSLTLSTPLENEVENNLQIKNIYDLHGNAIVDTTISFKYLTPSRYNVVINEILYDNSPSLGNYNSDFVELYNASDADINLENWQLICNSKDSYTLPNYTLHPGDFVVLGGSEYSGIANTIELTSNFNLNNSGTIYLSDNNSNVMDAIIYPIEFDSENFKDDGGWSIERIDYYNYAIDKTNWAYTEDLEGASFAETNSLYKSNPDYIEPELLNITQLNDSTFVFCFSESMKNPISLTFENYSEEYKLELSTIFSDSLYLTFSIKVDPNTLLSYEFDSQTMDYSGNYLQEPYQQEFGVADTVIGTELIINEILFDPIGDGVDFIEIYNNSNKVIDASNIYLSHIENGAPDKLLPLTEIPFNILPHKYIAACSDTAILKESHGDIISFQLIETNLPTLPNDEGNIALTKNTGEIIDYLEYSSSMHNPILMNTEGISLERISFNNATNNPNNWQSAAESYGFATPTQQNSQYQDIETQQKSSNDYIWFSSSTFTPDGNGLNDVLTINYQVDNNTWFAKISIYNRAGQLIKRIANADLLGQKGLYTWDGTNNNYELMPYGIYIVYAELYTSDGKRKREKHAVVLSSDAR